MTATKDHTVISISMDQILAGSGKLINGRLEDCGAQFCDNNDESIAVYDMIEDAIANGKNSVKVQFSDSDDVRVITWSLT